MRNLSDWLVSLFCLLVGAVGIQTSSRSDRWDFWINNNYRNIPLAKAVQTRGTVRVKISELNYWQGIGSDVTNELKELKPKLTGRAKDIAKEGTVLREGDEISTDAHSTAALELNDGTVLNVPTSSIVRLKLDEKAILKESQELPLLKKLSFLIAGTYPPVIPYLEVLKHSAPETSTHNSSAMTPLVPKILSPLSGSRFISSSNEKETIQMRWRSLPVELEPEIELKRLDDSSFSISLNPSASGVVVSLPDGEYSWRIRTLSGEKPSEWSETQEFSIQENLRGAKPVAISKHIEVDSTLDTAQEPLSEKVKTQRSLASIPPRRSSHLTLRPQAKPINRLKSLQDLPKFRAIAAAAEKRLNTPKLKSE